MPLSEFVGATAFVAWLKERDARLSVWIPGFAVRMVVETDEHWLALLQEWFEAYTAKLADEEAAAASAEEGS